jgi:hypothetical protein
MMYAEVEPYDPEGKEDFVVRVADSDGQVHEAKISVPRFIFEDPWIESSETHYGLNLVTKGHYQ